MRRIDEFGFDFFIPTNSIQHYENIYQSKKPILEKIYRLMTLNPKFMIEIPTDEDYYIKKTKESTLNELQNKIKKNEKIILTTFYFNTKPSKQNISGGIISPDAADFLTLLHLNTLVYYINKIYKPGCVLKLGIELNYFHKFAQVKFHQTDEMTNTLYKFNMICENFLNSQGQVLLFDIYKEVGKFKKEFLSKVENEKFNFIQKPEAIQEINRMAQYFLDFVLDENSFPNKEAAWNFALFHTLDVAGYKNALTSMFDTPNGLFENFSKSLYVQSRFVKDSHLETQDKKPEIYCSMLPGAQTFSFNALTLRRKNGIWQQILYKDTIENNYQPVFVQDLNYPFFYTEGD